MWWLYIIKCADSTLYTGITTDVQRRIAEHENGKGAKYTRGRNPLELVYTQEFENRSDASRAEVMVKRMSRDGKMELIESKVGIVI